MPVYIEEVEVEATPPETQTSEIPAAEDRIPTDSQEFTLLQTLTLLEERRQRLLFD